MFEKINEQIEVVVHFTVARPIPLLLTWRGKKFRITEVNFTHISHDGKVPLVHFAVSTSSEAFNITFNTHALTWQLNEIFFEGFRKNQSLNEQNHAKSYNAY